MKRIFYLFIPFFVLSCGEEKTFDAQGTFDATEIVVSSEATGRILNFEVEEGASVSAGEMVGVIDTLPIFLQRKQLLAQQSALLKSRPDVEKQVASLKEQIATQNVELQRVENMLRDGAATPKQKDDLQAKIRLLESQLAATLSSLDKNTSSINSNVSALEAQIEILDDRLAKCRIASPINGVVLVKYMEAGELATVGKPLMKVADLNNIFLRAYFTSAQLANLKLGDTVTVVANFGGEARFDYKGEISWISDESEFTPKTIQTQDSRANLVYAVKIKVQNDGRLKIGLSGEVKL